MRLSDFAARYDNRLRTDEFADVDPSPNGLQVGPPAGEIDHAAFAVDAAVATIERAVEADADVLVVHHGLIWGDLERVTDADYRRIAPLIEHDLALYVSHLPLDGHPDLGNAAGLADLLDLRDREPFGDVGGEPIGLRGRVAGDPLTADALEGRLGADLDTGPRDVRVLDFGPETLDDLAVVTGSGADFLSEAAATGVDVLITGEGKQQVYHEAREAGVSVVLAGHYATETFGVRSLRDLAADWGLETTYLDWPTGL